MTRMLTTPATHNAKKRARKASNRELIARLRKFRGRLSADFKFDRLEAAERGYSEDMQAVSESEN